MLYSVYIFVSLQRLYEAHGLRHVGCHGMSGVRGLGGTNLGMFLLKLKGGDVNLNNQDKNDLL